MEGKKILTGLAFPNAVFQGSLPEYLLPRMKEQSPEKIFEVNVKTGESITTRAFLKLSLEISEGYKALGMSEGDLVVVTAENSSKLHAAGLAAIWAGGAFAAIEFTMKLGEMSVLFTKLRPKFVVCEAEKAAIIHQALMPAVRDAIIITLDEKHDDPRYRYLLEIQVPVDVEGYSPRASPNPAEETAVIVCSSGSTGLPKGAMHTHRAMVYRLEMWRFIPGLDVRMSFLQSAHFFWISAVNLLFKCCYYGCTRYFLTKLDVDIMLKAIDKYKPFWSIISPTELHLITISPDFNKYDVSSLKVIFTGGALFPKIVADRIQEMWGRDLSLRQAYGMTELTGIVTDLGTEQDITTPGKPARGIQIKVVDVNTGVCLGTNQTGEIAVRGAMMMKGYIRDEEATKEVMKDGWYHTGDLGYYNENRNVYIVDRIKEIIKYRMLHIAPAEIEAFIESLKGIKEAGVVGIPCNEVDGYHPMALVVKTSESQITTEEILAKVKENLQDHKQLRAGVHFVSEIPRNGAGKIKRRELQALANEIRSQTSLTQQDYQNICNA